jgi:uncharacterized protein (DUF433 family)
VLSAFYCFLIHIFLVRNLPISPREIDARQHNRIACIWESIFTDSTNRLISCMFDWSECDAVERVPGRVSGAFVFKGTRLPVAMLFENLEAGATVSDFLKWYEGVTREQVLKVLRHAERSLAAA